MNAILGDGDAAWLCALSRGAWHMVGFSQAGIVCPVGGTSGISWHLTNVLTRNYSQGLLMREIEFEKE